MELTLVNKSRKWYVSGGKDKILVRWGKRKVILTLNWKCILHEWIIYVKASNLVNLIWIVLIVKGKRFGSLWICLQCPQPFWHQGLVSLKTVFPWIGVQGDGFQMIQANRVYCALFSIISYLAPPQISDIN